jgi:hypothetical protein
VHWLKELFTGVAICSGCGRSWELFRAREDEAVCSCGARLRPEHDAIPKSSGVEEVNTAMTKEELEQENSEMRAALEEIYDLIADALGLEDDEAEDPE